MKKSLLTSMAGSERWQQLYSVNGIKHYVPSIQSRTIIEVSKSDITFKLHHNMSSRFPTRLDMNLPAQLQLTISEIKPNHNMLNRLRIEKSWCKWPDAHVAIAYRQVFL